jgi:hypothetical protein
MHYPDEEETAREDETEAMGEHEGGSRNPGPAIALVNTGRLPSTIRAPAGERM